MKIGDVIKCRDADDMAEVAMELAKCGIDTEFSVERGGKRGLWLEVVGIEPPAEVGETPESGGAYADNPTIRPAT